MSKKLKRKATLMVIIELICVIILGLFLYRMQINISANEQTTELSKKIEPLRDTVAESKVEAEDHTTSYDAMYRAKASTLAYMVQEEIDADKPTDALMQQYKELLNVTNALILDKEGNVIAKAQTSGADFTYARYNQLRTVLTSDETSEPFEVEREDGKYRYYAADIDADTIAVIEQDPTELDNLLNDTVTWKSILRNISVGSTGYAFAVSKKDYTFLYHPKEDIVGQDSLDAGIQVEDLEDGNTTWMEIYGKNYLCTVADVDDAYVICAIPIAELEDSCNVTVLVVLCIFFAVITLLVTYAIFIMKAQEEDEDDPADHKKFGKFYFNKKVGTKLGAMIVAGLICVFVSSLYMQQLFSLSSKSMSNSQHIATLQTTILQYEDNVKMLEDQYNTRYLNKCRAAAHILKQKPELRNREDLAKLSKVIDVEFISFFDSTGTITATNSYYMNFKLSDDENSQSYEFKKLLAGGDYVIQDAQEDEALGVYRQYVGVSIRNDDGLTDGFVQICVNPEKLQHATEKLQVASILKGVQVGSNGFVFAVNKEDNTLAYYPNDKYIGSDATQYGIKESQIHDGFSDYLTISSQKYFANCVEAKDYYVFACVPASEIASHKVQIALVSTAVSLVFLLIMSLLLCFNRETKVTEKVTDNKKSASMFDVTMPDGQKKKTMDVSSRWSNVALHWSDKTPEQKMITVLKVLLGIYAVLICIAYISQKQSGGNGSMFSYIINGGWERGVNVFAATGCIFVICIVITLTVIIQEVLRVLSNISSAQGETIFRLVSNFVKYASVIALLYYCFALLGVDTATLLASAGIIGLMISLGAQKLVSDILAGLFIIFEGEFRVGDIVTIGDWRGTVVEIGIRTTKIEEGGGNMKVINNSAISGVINMTKQYSVAACDFGIEDCESFEELEQILKEELPKIKKYLPEAKTGPSYKGITELGSGKVSVKIVAQCSEGDRIQLIRDMNREVKLLFDKYDDINIVSSSASSTI